MNRPLYTCELVRAVDLSRAVRSFEFRFVEPARFDFEAGQYVSVEFSLDGKTHTRSYSVASSPGEADRIEICVKHVEGAVGTRYLWGINPGFRLTVSGPFGSFCLRQPDLRDSLFIAAGTGIAPIRSMLLSVLGGRGGPEMKLLFGVRNQEGILYDEEFKTLQQENRNFSYDAILSRPGNGWHGLQGYVQHHIEDALRIGRPLDVYVSGMRAMVDEVRGILEERNFDRASIHYERHA